MNVDPSLIAIVVALAVGLATVMGGFAAGLIIEATKGDIDIGSS